ncbi:hypothetical protein [Piscinibacter sp. HJYY11]|uniref:hypothetical protein n=1 Tax=Piscinibacter sp. HJYY11 TaxID=2801333 RepID=UPI00191F71EF|nr:hypothetical protein [Piscinibacter sp. HJYY11]MBL0727548.1 hypothetical protein [Piscinibacter sp. HJYY11]
MFKTQFERPATVLLSAMWSLAVVLAIAAFAASAFAASSAAGPAAAVVPASHAARPATAQSVESVTRSSMLREPRLAISKDKLD